MLPSVYIRKFSLVVALAASAALPVVGHAQTTPAVTRELRHKDPTTATVLGIVFPGGGQIYTERWGKAGAVFGGTLAATGLAINAANNDQHSIESVWVVGAVAIWTYGWVTANSDARRRNAQRLRPVFAPFLDQHNGRMVAGLSLETY
jgi:Family of unknown function (DUF5683)